MKEERILIPILMAILVFFYTKNLVLSGIVFLFAFPISFFWESIEEWVKTKDLSLLTKILFTDMEDDKFAETALTKNSEFSICIGKDEFTKEWFWLDLSKTGHIGVYGKTQVGKSVLYETMLFQIVMKCDPTKIQIAIADPQKTSFRIFAGVPHLFKPIARQETPLLIKTIKGEMDRRNNLFNQIPTSRKCDGIGDYLRLYQEYDLPFLPYIVCFLDEVSFLINNSGKDTEKDIQDLLKSALGYGIKIVFSLNRGTVKNLSNEAQSQIDTVFAGMIYPASEKRFAGIPSDMIPKFSNRVGSFAVMHRGVEFADVTVVKIPVDILEENVEKISEEDRTWEELQLHQNDFRVRRKWEGTHQDKLSALSIWIIEEGFTSKPSPADVMNAFEIRSTDTASKWLNETIEFMMTKGALPW